MSRRGFTLVEALVVIAILALLAAILFPLFSRAKEEGKRTTCQGNLHQFALALQMYRADYDGKGFSYNDKMGRSYPYNHFKGMKSYLGDGSILWCPDEHVSGVTLHGFVWYFTWAQEEGPNVTVRRPFMPEPGSVVAVCAGHASDTEYDARYGPAGNLRVGTYFFVREDTSLGRAKNGQITSYWCGSQGCSEWNQGKPGQGFRPKFPGEPWPPQPES